MTIKIPTIKNNRIVLKSYEIVRVRRYSDLRWIDNILEMKLTPRKDIKTCSSTSVSKNVKTCSSTSVNYSPR